MSGDSTLLDRWVGKFMPSGGYSSRRGNPVRLAAFHTTEGARDVESLGAWFKPKSRQASSHCGADDTGGSLARYVPEATSAWTAGNANPHATQLELCAFAAWTVKDWEAHPRLLEAGARWAAAVSLYHDIPLVRISGATLRTGRGFTTHRDLVAVYGGTHQDCGAAFRDVIFDRILARARVLRGQALDPGAPTSTTPTHTEEDDDMKLTDAIRNANPFGNKDTPMSNVGNVIQDIQANAATAARTISQLPGLIADVRGVLADVVRRLDELEKR